jgi:hypothetical protein
VVLVTFAEMGAAEPQAFARCAALGADRASLARCTRLSRAQRLILGAAVAEEVRQGAELQELLAEIAAARRASERLPPPRPRLMAGGAVRGDLGAALGEIPDRQSRLRPVPKVASGGGGGSR